MCLVRTPINVDIPVLPVTLRNSGVIPQEVKVKSAPQTADDSRINMIEFRCIRINMAIMAKCVVGQKWPDCDFWVITSLEYDLIKAE